MRTSLISFGLYLTLFSGWLAFTVAAVEPIEKNIIYVHIPAAITALACFCVLFVCSIQYLRTGQKDWDYIAAASAEVGLVFATVLNVTGMIFARAEWGTFWTPSPRLVSSAVLWFLYAAYLILRSSFNAGCKQEKVSAVFGIIAFADIPLVIISARFIRDVHRPAFSFDTGWQITALLLAILGTIFLAAVLIWIKTDILKVAGHNLENTENTV
jgi:heme exporter protein C